MSPLIKEPPNIPPHRKRRKYSTYFLLLVAGCDKMTDVDLMNIGSYTELPGGNVIIPEGYSALLNHIIKVI